MIAPRIFNSSFLNPKSSFRRRSRRSGLTAIELVSALALFVIILGMLLITINGATDTWALSTSKNAGQSHVRRIVDMLADDLTSAVGERPTDDDVKPWFIIDYPASRTNQCGVYFVKALSPAETSAKASGNAMRSLQLVAYVLATETNLLSRYTAPVTLNTTVGDQLSAFFNDHKTDGGSVSNVLSTLVTTFGTTACTNTPPATAFNEPGYYDNTPGKRVGLRSLPDFVDIGIAYTNREDHAQSSPSYMIRRVTLPAAQASRLP